MYMAQAWSSNLLTLCQVVIIDVYSSLLRTHMFVYYFWNHHAYLLILYVVYACTSYNYIQKAHIEMLCSCYIYVVYIL